MSFLDQSCKVPPRRHSGQAEREPESSPLRRNGVPCLKDSLNSRPGLLSGGVTFFCGNDGSIHISRKV